LIVGISKDLTVCKRNNCAAGMTSNDSEEWYIHLAFPQPDHAKQVQVQADGDGISPSPAPAPRYNRRVQVPLVLFCELLQQKFKIQFQEMENLSSNPPNLCFIADASSSMASHLLSEVLVKTKLLERKVPGGNLEVDDDDDNDDDNDNDDDDDDDDDEDEDIEENKIIQKKEIQAINDIRKWVGMIVKLIICVGAHTNQQCFSRFRCWISWRYFWILSFRVDPKMGALMR